MIILIRYHHAVSHYIGVIIITLITEKITSLFEKSLTGSAALHYQPKKFDFCSSLLNLFLYPTAIRILQHVDIYWKLGDISKFRSSDFTFQSTFTWIRLTNGADCSGHNYALIVHEYSSVSTSMSDIQVAEHQVISFKKRKNYPSIKEKTIVGHVRFNVCMKPCKLVIRFIVKAYYGWCRE
jgi:hypothetical protein